jgi:hypothetical protein
MRGLKRLFTRERPPKAVGTGKGREAYVRRWEEDEYLPDSTGRGVRAIQKCVGREA